MIFVECKPDETLVEALGISRENLRHVRDKPRVIKLVRKYDGSIGLIDEDPFSAQPSFLKEFREVDFEHHVRLLKHGSDKESYLVVLCPRLEEWVLDAAKEVRLDPQKYGLPAGAAELKRVINYRLDCYRKFIEKILGEKSQRFEKLKSLLSGCLAK